MKPVASFSRWIGCSLVAAALCAASTAQAMVGKAIVKEIRGTVSFSEQGGEWKPLTRGKALNPGSSIKTGVNSQVDLFIDDNGPIVRLLEDSTLGIDKLNFDRTGGEVVIETLLDLRQGTVQGVVKKLAAASKYEVKTPNAVAGIRGTEYEISADDKVHCREGSMMVAYTNPANKRISTHVVNEGQTFVPPANPAGPNPTPTVRATQPGEVHARIKLPPPPGSLVSVPVTYETFVSPLLDATGQSSDEATPRGE